MADKTPIEWSDATWNPITGCSVISPGCTNCYAMRLAGTRMKTHPSRAGLTIDTKAGPVWNGQVRLNEQWLIQPLQWKRPRMIFVCAHADLFHESVPDEWIDRVFAVMALAPHHQFQVLTKRSARMRDYMQGLYKSGRYLLWQHPLSKGSAFCAFAATFEKLFANVWLGVSAEDQRRADERIPDLLATPAAIRWLSAEPLLGPMDLNAPLYPGEAGITMRGFLRDKAEPDDFRYWARKLDWVVAGGESGPGARPMHPDWARSLRDQCAAAGVPFLFKQWGEWAPMVSTGGTPGEAGTLSAHTIHCSTDRRRIGRRTYFAHHGADRRATILDAVGKKAAGRWLDGFEHNGFPSR